jgi:predicted aspartyl protease
MGIIRKSFQLEGRKRKKEVACLIDTGASTSFVRPDLVRKLGLPKHDLVKPIRIRLGKGEARVSQLATAAIHINGAVLADPAFVLPGLTEEYVIGGEFLERYEIRLEPKSGRLMLPPKRRLGLLLV